MPPKPLTTERDRTAIQKLASARWPQGWHPGGLGWSLARWLVDDASGSDIVVLPVGDAGDEISAWATRGGHEVGEVSVQCAEPRPDSVAAALDWALDGLDDTEVSIEVFDGDEVLAAELIARGVLPDRGRPVVGMFRAAGGPPAELDGYQVRAVAEAEVEERVEVHRRAWRPASLPWADGRTVDPEAESSFSLAAYAAVRATWLYRADLDLVVEAPDGSLAACCIAWLDPGTGVAEIEPVGVDPAHRRRGLAVALCLEAARQVAALGGDQLFLNVAPSEAYPANAAAYAKAGFRFVERGVHHVRPPASS